MRNLLSIFLLFCLATILIIPAAHAKTEVLCGTISVEREEVKEEENDKKDDKKTEDKEPEKGKVKKVSIFNTDGTFVFKMSGKSKKLALEIAEQYEGKEIYVKGNVKRKKPKKDEEGNEVEEDDEHSISLKEYGEMYTGTVNVNYEKNNRNQPTKKVASVYLRLKKGSIELDKSGQYSILSKLNKTAVKVTGRIKTDRSGNGKDRKETKKLQVTAIISPDEKEIKRIITGQDKNDDKKEKKDK